MNQSKAKLFFKLTFGKDKLFIMEFIGILFALFFAVMLTAVYKLAFRNILGGFWAFFILMFFISLAAGEWAAHRGPSFLGYYWVPGLIAAILVALVMASVSPAPPATAKGRLKPKSDRQTEKAPGTEALVSAAVVGIFFWILIAALVLITIVGIASRW